LAGDGDESVERDLFVRRSRVRPAGNVPPLGHVLQRASAREAPMPGGRVVMGAALVAACFAALVGGQPGGRPWTGVVSSGAVWADSERTGARDVDAGAGGASGVEGPLASWDWYGADEMCRVDGVRARSREEAAACFAPLPARVPAPVPAARARVACESDETCRVGEP
jgi:hypothetical protein